MSVLMSAMLKKPSIGKNKLGPYYVKGALPEGIKTREKKDFINGLCMLTVDGDQSVDKNNKPIVHEDDSKHAPEPGPVHDCIKRVIGRDILTWQRRVSRSDR